MMRATTMARMPDRRSHPRQSGHDDSGAQRPIPCRSRDEHDSHALLTPVALFPLLQRAPMKGWGDSGSSAVQQTAPVVVESGVSENINGEDPAPGPTPTAFGRRAARPPAAHKSERTCAHAHAAGWHAVQVHHVCAWSDECSLCLHPFPGTSTTLM